MPTNWCFDPSYSKDLKSLVEWPLNSHLLPQRKWSNGPLKVILTRVTQNRIDFHQDGWSARILHRYTDKSWFKEPWFKKETRFLRKIVLASKMLVIKLLDLGKKNSPLWAFFLAFFGGSLLFILQKNIKGSKCVQWDLKFLDMVQFHCFKQSYIIKSAP